MREPRLGLFVHTCLFANGLIIDEHDAEFLHCLCFGEDEHILGLKDDLAIKLDFERAAIEGDAT